MGQCSCALQCRLAPACGPHHSIAAYRRTQACLGTGKRDGIGRRAKSDSDQASEDRLGLVLVWWLVPLPGVAFHSATVVRFLYHGIAYTVRHRVVASITDHYWLPRWGLPVLSESVGNRGL